MRPNRPIFAGAILFRFAGVALTGRTRLGIAVMLSLAVPGWLMTSFGYPVIVFIIAFFLGERFETSLSQSLVRLQGDPARLAWHPIALALLVLSVVAVWWLHRRRPAFGEA